MRKTVLLVAITCITIAGCGGTVETDLTTSTPTPPAVEMTSVDVQVKSWGETEALIASHKGKIVVVDAWADW